MNLIVTIINTRSAGLTWERLTLFVWSIFITAWLLILSLPVLAGGPLIVPALNLAVCWNNIAIKLCQSAENLLSYKILGILRDYTPDFMCLSLPIIRTIKDGSSCNINEEHTTLISCDNYFINRFKTIFGPYIAGLIEGGGSIFVPEYPNKRNDKGKLIYPSIQISFNVKDYPLIIILQKNLGGSINKKIGVNAYIYTITKRDSQLQFCYFVNGYFRTPKINTFNKLIIHLNTSTDKLSIPILPLDHSSLSSNYWLAGFIDADGSFHIRVTNHPFKVAFQFELEQRQVDISGDSMIYIMEKIGTFIECKVKETKTNTKNPKLRVRTTSIKGNDVLVDYLNRFPLNSSKYLDYCNWRDGFLLFKDKQHLTTEGLNKIKGLKENLNSKRKEFNWDHLLDFFC